MAVVFGDGSEPWSVARGGVKRWLHCRVDVDVLPDKRYEELADWLVGHSLAPTVSTLLVTRGDDGYQVHTSEGPSDVDFEDLPMWMQRPQPQQAKPASRVGRAGR